MEPRIILAYGIIAVMAVAAAYVFNRFRRERARRRDILRGRYRDRG